MAKVKIKKGDQVFVTTGVSKDLSTAKEVLRVFPDKNKAIVSGVNMIKRHTKPSAENPQGGIVETEAPIHISNLAIADPKENTPSKIGYKIEEGKKVRISKKSGEAV